MPPLGEVNESRIQPRYHWQLLAAAISLLVITCSTWLNEMRPDPNTRSSMAYSLQIVCEFLYNLLGCVNSEGLLDRAYCLKSLSQKT